MIVSSCPLRVSLVGGSTDHPEFIKRYGRGSVISFPSNLNTYISIHQDYFGMNSINKKYLINYSKKENVDNIKDIKNELIRVIFEHFDVEEINCSMTSDVFSVGSGLAASSSYIMALINAIYIMRGEKISSIELCKLGEMLEKKFNPYVGQQDFYGSCIGGLKRIDFGNCQYTPTITFLKTNIFDEMNIYLFYTEIHRKSTQILKSINVEKSIPLLNDVEMLEKAINNVDVKSFNEIMNQTWENKKKISKYICKNKKLIEIDNMLQTDNDVLSHKLCGAGNGGYFLVFSHKNVNLMNNYFNIKQIKISETGIQHINLKNGFNRI